MAVFVAAHGAWSAGWAWKKMHPRLRAQALPPDTSAEDVEWSHARRVMQPPKTFGQRLKLSAAVDRLPRTYICCKRARPDDGFRQFAERARREPGWTCHDIDASHSPHVTAPDLLTGLLDRIACPPS